MQLPNLKVSVSSQCFKSKDAITPKSLQFERSYINIDRFIELIQDGYCFCHWFNTPKDCFNISHKRNSAFECANIVFVDVDDCSICMDEFVALLSNKPTIYYTTLSNGMNGLFRFRLGYVFYEDITTAELYKATYEAIKNLISLDAFDYPLTDDCGSRCSQYMNGNGSSGCVVKTTNKAYSLCNFGVGLRAAQTIEITNHKETKEHATEFGFSDMEFKEDVDSLSPLDLIQKYRDRYQYFDRTKLDFNDGYALTPENFQEIHRTWYWDCHKSESGREYRFTTIKRIRDGERRRKTLFISALIRRSIMPTISFEQLLFNLICERTWYYDNSDKVLSNHCLMTIARDALAIPHDEIKLHSSRKRPKYKIDKAYCAENGVSAKTKSNEVRRLLNDAAIGELYDVGLSVGRNLEILRSNGLKVGKSKLYQFCREHGISTKGETTTTL